MTERGTLTTRAFALARLAGQYARHLARRALSPQPAGAGLRRFLALYSPERLTEITAEERRRLPTHGGCIACGLCNFAAAGAGYLRSERLPLQLTRHLPDLWTLRDLDLDAVAFGAGAAVCPMGVPLDAMRDLVAGRLARDGTAPPPPRVVP